MTTPFEIPTQPAPQRYSITLAGKDYRITQRWNVATNSWVIDIADAGDVPIIRGIPLVTGTDLLDQFEYLGIGGQLIAQTDHNPDAVPSYENLGSIGHLYFVVP